MDVDPKSDSWPDAVPSLPKTDTIRVKEEIGVNRCLESVDDRIREVRSRIEADLKTRSSESRNFGHFNESPFDYSRENSGAHSLQYPEVLLDPAGRRVVEVPSFSSLTEYHQVPFENVPRWRRRPPLVRYIPSGYDEINRQSLSSANDFSSELMGYVRMRKEMLKMDLREKLRKRKETMAAATAAAAAASLAALRTHRSRALRADERVKNSRRPAYRRKFVRREDGVSSDNHWKREASRSSSSSSSTSSSSSSEGDEKEMSSKGSNRAGDFIEEEGRLRTGTSRQMGARGRSPSHLPPKSYYERRLWGQSPPRQNYSRIESIDSGCRRSS